MSEAHHITLFLCGDVMLGRGIDQALPHPSEPTLHEPAVLNAQAYVDLAEQQSGAIARPMTCQQLWGDALIELDRAKPDLRLINLETSITTSDLWDRGKGIHYRMHPKHVACLRAAAIDGCALANNHVLDWGTPGLVETIETLRRAGIATIGAGRNLDEAGTPMTWRIEHAAGSPRVVMFAFACASSGVPASWAATADRPGVHYLPDLSDASASRAIEHINARSRAEDRVIASIHWGENWGYDIPPEQIAFAHRLIDAAGVDLIHGHSSHHPKAFEVYRDRLILYGCGDFLTDYEGIAGKEPYQPELTLMYLPTLDAATGRLMQLRLVPLRLRRFSLHCTGAADTAWLADMLTREGARFNVRAHPADDHHLQAHWT